MSYAKSLVCLLTGGWIPSALAHPYHDASRFTDTMLHPVLDANHGLLMDFLLLITGVALALLLGIRVFEFVIHKLSAQKTQRSPRPLR